MKKIYTGLLSFLMLMSVTGNLFAADGTASVLLRPTYIDLSSATAQSAVLVNLTGYSSDAVKYKLYISTTQYYCWDNVSGTFVTSNSYADGPNVPGTPSASSTFWIVFQAGTNLTTTASYRDRIDPYTSNNNTVALPAATQIATPFNITGTLLPATLNTLADKYVVLAYSGTDLISATSSDLTTGTFSVVCEDGTTIDKLEIRTLNNVTIGELTGSWTADADAGDIQLIDVVDNEAPVWATDYPKIVNVLDESFDLAAKLDETGTIFYVVVANGDGAPSVAQVMAGQNSAGDAAMFAGSFAGSSAETTETVSGLTLGVTYDIYLVAEDAQPTPNVQASVVMLSATTAAQPSVILLAGFETALDPFTQVSVIGDQVWAVASGSGTTYAKISGYSGSALDNEDWLISPAIDLDATTGNSFDFMSAMNYGGPALQVFISSDFSGTFDSTGVSEATWTDITSDVALSPGSWTWTNSGSVDLSAYSGTVYVAFKYTSNPTDGAGTWEVTDFKVTGFLSCWLRCLTLRPDHWRHHRHRL